MILVSIERCANAIFVSLERSRLSDVPFDIFGQIRPKIKIFNIGVCTGCIFWTESCTNVILFSLERSRLDVPFDIFCQIRPKIGREIGEIRPKNRVFLMEFVQAISFE